MVFLEVAVLGAHVTDRRQTSAIARGERAAEEIDVLDGIGHEGRLEAQDVVYVVEQHAIEQEEVLVEVAAAHRHLARPRKSRLHAGQDVE